MCLVFRHLNHRRLHPMRPTMRQQYLVVVVVVVQAEQIALGIAAAAAVAVVVAIAAYRQQSKAIVGFVPDR